MRNSSTPTYFSKNSLTIGILIISTLILGACSSNSQKPVTDINNRPYISKVFNPYRADVVQGNFISKEQLESIRPGMTKEQVKQILGTPLLTDIFHNNRWDYVYSYRRGDTQEVEKRKISLLFDGLLLAKINGDDVPTELGLINEIDDLRKNRKKQAKPAETPDNQKNARVVPAFPSSPDTTGPDGMPTSRN